MRQFRDNLVRWSIALVIVLAFGEFIVRVSVTTPSNQQFDEQLGWTYVPHSTIYSSREGGAFLKLNSLGANDLDPALKRHKQRILFLGDSITEALQVPREENFTTVLEGLAPQIDAVNLGRSAMGPVHYPVLIDRHWASLTPDEVVIVLSPGDLLDTLQNNVVVKTDLESATESIGLAPAMNDRIKEKLGPLLRRSALVTHLARRLKPVLTQSVKDAMCWVRNCSANDAPEVRDQSYAERYKAEAERRLRLVLAPLARTKNLSIVHVPALIYKTERRVEHQYPWEGAIYQTVCASLDIPYLDTTAALKKSYQASGQPGHGFSNAIMGQGHLNAEGHRAVAQAIHGWLQNRTKSATDERSAP